MKVLNLSYDDYANFAHENANALRSVGVDCVDIKRVGHAFDYKSESDVVGVDKTISLIEESDIIQIFHSDSNLLNYVKGKNKRVVVYHTGTRYRMNPKGFNRLFNPHVEKSIIALCEFEGLGAKNEHYVVGAINVDNDLNIKRSSAKKVVGHFPSNPMVKGTGKILEMLKRVEHPFILLHSTDLVDHRRQLYRMQQCDIYVELFNPKLYGREYGSWGITALEAAAMGSVVVTQNLHDDFYRKHYGDHPLILCGNSKQFVDKVNELLSLLPAELNKLKRDTRKWVIDNHSYPATGKRIKNILGI